MNRVLVIFYSYTGLSRQLAEVLCAGMGWPLGEVVETRPRSGATGTLRCVLDSVLRRRPAVRYHGPAPADFDVVVLVSPVWLYRLAGPMRSFVAGYARSLRRVAVLSAMGRTGAPNAVAEIAHILGRTPILAAAMTAQEIEQGRCAARLRLFGGALLPSTEEDAAVRPATLSPSAA